MAHQTECEQWQIKATIPYRRKRAKKGEQMQTKHVSKTGSRRIPPNGKRGGEKRTKANGIWSRTKNGENRKNGQILNKKYTKIPMGQTGEPLFKRRF